MGILKALVPRIKLPPAFMLRSEPQGPVGVQLTMEAQANDLHRLERVVDLEERASLLDLIELFPSVTADQVPKMLKPLGFIRLPRTWKLTGDKATVFEEGRVVTENGTMLRCEMMIDGQTHVWNKTYKVDAIELKEMLDIVEWIRGLYKHAKAQGYRQD